MVAVETRSRGWGGIGGFVGVGVERAESCGDGLGDGCVWFEIDGIRSRHGTAAE
jgi:hypothetical protein